MRKFLLTVLFVVVSSFALMAQDLGKMDVFGGYSYVRLNPGNGATGTNNNGWESTMTARFMPRVGIAADFDGQYKSESGASNHLYTFMFGPEFKAATGKGAPFAHALFGFAHDSVSASVLGVNVSASDNAFATALGGGYDWRASDQFSVRLFQADYLMTRFGGSNQNNIRLSFGLVIHPSFGR
jgi:hypothetical protein